MTAAEAPHHSGVPVQVQAPKPGATSVARALADMREGVGQWRFACLLGWLDITLRYRGSLLGPLWITLSSAIMTASMGLLYGRLFHQDLTHYLPFLALSLTLWQTGLMSVLQESCVCFIDADSLLRSARTPYTVLALRVIVRNALVLAHNIVVPLVVFVIYSAWPGRVGLLGLPGIALWMLDGFAACLFLGGVCARFRDVPPIVASLLQIAFYVTPIIWQPGQLHGHTHWLLFNPFYPLLEIVREPLLGQVPDAALWYVAGGESLVFAAIAVLAFARMRTRLAFWI